MSFSRINIKYSNPIRFIDAEVEFNNVMTEYTKIKAKEQWESFKKQVDDAFDIIKVSESNK